MSITITPTDSTKETTRAMKVFPGRPQTDPEESLAEFVCERTRSICSPIPNSVKRGRQRSQAEDIEQSPDDDRRTGDHNPGNQRHFSLSRVSAPNAHPAVNDRDNPHKKGN